MDPRFPTEDNDSVGVYECNSLGKDIDRIEEVLFTTMEKLRKYEPWNKKRNQ